MSETFADLGVPNDLVSILDSLGLVSPFRIQAATLIDSLAGRDICGKAPTGSGKTLAFTLPLVATVKRSQPKRPRGLVLVPTRELAAQVLETVEQFTSARDLRAASIYGGVGFGKQLKSLRQGVDILIACPGRLEDLIESNAVSLQNVNFVVIDEADRMADMGFLPAVERLLSQTNSNRQTSLFSATLDGDVDVLIRKYLNNPVKHEVIPPKEENNSLHLFWKVSHDNRVDVCAKVLERSGPSIIFTRTKHGADRLCGQLEKSHIKAVAIHGGRSQPQRDRALSEFSTGRVNVLVATDVASRGIHVEGVQCIIHYDVPEDYKAYLHRSGRTARAGNTGTVVSLVQPDKIRAMKHMQRLLKLNQPIGEVDLQALPELTPEQLRPVKSGLSDRKAPRGFSDQQRKHHRNRPRRNNRKPKSNSSS